MASSLLHSHPSVSVRGRAHVKVSTTLPARDVAFVEEYVASHRLPSRAAGFQAAVAALRELELQSAYQDAYAEWSATEDAAMWDATSGDGVEALA